MNHEILDYLVVSAISFGMAFSFSVTSGPFGLFKTVRSRLEDSEYQILKEGVSCPVCMSFWFSLIVSLSMGHGITGWLFSWGVTSVVTSLSPE